MTRAWRIFQERFGPGLDGEGARLYGGRWNEPGVPAVYTAEHLSLAVLENVVHFDRQSVRFHYQVIYADLPTTATIEEVDPTSLPSGWTDPILHPRLVEIGTEWARSGRTAVLRVPSCIVPQERNLVLNPLHPDFREIQFQSPEPHRFDARLLAMAGR